MALSPFIYHYILFFLPYQNLAHYRTLFDFFADLILYRNVTAQRKVYLLLSLCTLFCLQNLYLWSCLPSPMDRLRQGDLVNLIIQEDSFNLVMVAIELMTMYFIGQLCFTMKHSFLRLFENLLFKDTNGTLQGVGYGTVSEQATAQYIILGLINLLNVFILCDDAVLLLCISMLLTTAIQFPGELLGSPLTTPLAFTLNVSWILASTLNTVTCIVVYVKILANIAALGAGFICILFRRLLHSERILAAYKLKNSLFSWTPFRQYLDYSGQTFQVIFTANATFGRLFFAFLLVNMPISAWILVRLFFVAKSRASVIALSLIVAHQLLGCILLHWTVAKLTKRLHAPSKTLLRLNASTGHRMGNFRARLQLHHTIVRLHTKAKYGFTYGSVGGLITMGSFAKCMILYTELIMYAYKFIWLI